MMDQAFRFAGRAGREQNPERRRARTSPERDRGRSVLLSESDEVGVGPVFDAFDRWREDDMPDIELI